MTISPIEPRRALVAQRRQALMHLAEVRRQHGCVPTAVMCEVARRLGLHPNHLGRLLRQFEQTKTVSERPGSTRKKAILNEHRAQVAFFMHNGNATAAYRYLLGSDCLPPGMSLRGFQRRVLEWDPALRACAKGGYRAMIKHQFFNIEHIPYKGYAYGTDHTALPILVVPKRGYNPIWPWLSIMMDLKTRLVLAYLVTGDDPTAVDDIDLLAEALHGWYTADGMFVGGKPHFLRTDRGGDYISKALTSNLLDLDIGRQFTEPYSSWQNGRVEALNGTIDQDFAPAVPGFHPGGEAEYTRRVLKTPIPITSLMTMETLDRRLGDFFGEYNNRVHSSLNGMTPLEAWAADTRSMDVVDRETICAAMSRREDRRLNHYGIETRNGIYSHPTLARLRKQNVSSVEVRYHAHDRHHIEIVVDGARECTAVKTTVLPDHHRLGVLSVRAKQRREMERLIREADFQRVVDERARLADEGVDESEWPVLPPLTADDEDGATDTGVVNLSADDGIVDVIDSASAYAETLGATLSGAAVADWRRRLDDGPVEEADDPELPLFEPPTSPEDGAA